MILWPGACNVHQRFRPEHVDAVRQRLPGVRVVVHPECPMEVVDLADDAGSTAHIIAQVEAAPPGAQWAIGTEARLVHRLQADHPEQQIVSLADVPPFCRTMSQITLAEPGGRAGRAGRRAELAQPGDGGRRDSPLGAGGAGTDAGPVRFWCNAFRNALQPGEE